MKSCGEPVCTVLMRRYLRTTLPLGSMRNDVLK